MHDVLRSSVRRLPHDLEIDTQEVNEWCSGGCSTMLPWSYSRDTHCGERLRGLTVERARMVRPGSRLRTHHLPFCDGSQSPHEEAA